MSVKENNRQLNNCSNRLFQQQRDVTPRISFRGQQAPDFVDLPICTN